MAAAVFAAAAGAIAQEGNRADAQIYQQRTEDGRIVFTDRPVAGAVTQRTWQVAPEDAATAGMRREESRLEALAVNTRIQRWVEAQRQRDHELALVRMQLAEAEARLDAERTRAEAAVQPAVVFVRSFAPRQFLHPPRGPQTRPPRPRSPTQPGFGMFAAPPA